MLQVAAAPVFTVYLKRCAQALYIGCVVAATKSFETM